MRRARWFVCATALVAATALGARAQILARPDSDLLDLIARAHDLPPEFAADALIRLAGSPRLRDNELRRALIDEAFGRAFAAQDAYGRTATVGVPPDSRQGAQIFADATALTRLSLQVRAAQLMLFVDPLHARELFGWIDLHLQPGTCEDPLVPSVDEYYTAVSLFARRSFPDERGEAIRFLELYVFRAHLPTEMAAIARAIQRFRPDAFEAAYLEGVVRWILDKGSIDPRGFSSADLDIVSRMADLQKADHEIGVSGSHLMDGLRTYLVRQLSGPRCSDSVTEAMTPASFNGAIGRVHAEFDVEPIDPASVRPSRMLGAARIEPYWQSPDARALRAAAVALRGTDRLPLPERIRRTKEWQEEAEQLLAAVQQWHGPHEPTERDVFYQKSVLFSGIIDLIPSGSVRAHALRAFVEFMRESDLDRVRRSLWFAFMNRLVATVEGEERASVLQAFEDSHHPVLSFYARMQRLTSRDSNSSEPPFSGTR